MSAEICDGDLVRLACDGDTVAFRLLVERHQHLRPAPSAPHCAAACPATTRPPPDTLQRRFLNTGGIIENHCGQTTIRPARRTYSPVLRQASLPETITVPWWQGRTLRYHYD
jgi:hypothetical protein